MHSEARGRHCWFPEKRGEYPKQQQVLRKEVPVPLLPATPRGTIRLVIAEVWHHLRQHERGHHRPWCPRWLHKQIVRSLAIAVTGMAHEESIAPTQQHKALVVGTVPEGTMGDDAVVGAVLVGQRSNLPGEGIVGAKTRVEALEAEEAATQLA